MKKILILSLLLLCFSFGSLGFAEDSESTTTTEDDGKGACKPGEETGYCIPINEKFNDYEAIRGKDGFELYGNYVGMIYKYAASIIGIIVILIIVVSGVQIIAGGASSESSTDAKNRIYKAISSLVLLFLIGLILKTINPGFFGEPCSDGERSSLETDFKSAETDFNTKSDSVKTAKKEYMNKMFERTTCETMNMSTMLIESPYHPCNDKYLAEQESKTTLEETENELKESNQKFEEAKLAFANCKQVRGEKIEEEKEEEEEKK